MKPDAMEKMAARCGLKESTSEIPPSDPRAAACALLNKMCRDCIETCRELQNEERKPDGQRNDRLVGRLEERLFTMVDEIHKEQRRLYLDQGIQIYIGHTSSGLPIMVHPANKKRLWDS